MAKRDKRLEKMRRNPRDWRIERVATICRGLEVQCDPPSGGGDHWTVGHHSQDDKPVVVAANPINPFYIKRLVRFLDRVQYWREENERADDSQRV